MLFRSEANQKLIQSRTKDKEVDKVEENKEVEVKEVEVIEKETEVTIDDFAKIELKVAKVVNCENHPKADKLLVLTLQIGEETRTVVSGIKQFYSPEDLIGKNVVAITNLKPVKLRGIESKGMILAAEDDQGKLSLLTTLEEVKNGAVIS